MGFLDFALRSVGLQRMDAGEGGLRASRRGRLSAAFEQERRHINSAIMAGGSVLRARSRYHVRENALLGAAKETWVAFSVGSGISPSWVGLKPEVKKALHKAFNRWAKRCDFDGRTTYYGLQAIIEWEVFEAGECFVRLIRHPLKPLRLQLIRSEQLPYDVSFAAQSGREIRLGIEFDTTTQERVAYHFWKQDPGDGTKAAQPEQLQRVPAEDVLHIMRVDQPGQLRGMPRTKAALIPAAKLDSYDDNLLERANVASAFAVFMKKTGDDRSSGGVANGEGPEGQPEAHIEAGTIIDCLPGEEPVPIQPPDPGSNYEAFRYQQATRVTSVMGTPYAETTGDLRKANYSSTRAGRTPLKRRVEQHQQFWLIPQFCDPVVQAWVADALLRGVPGLPSDAPMNIEAYDDVNHVPPYWEYVDPRGDAQADIMLADNLMKSRSRIAAERGEDPVEMDEEIAEDQARESRLKLRRGGSAKPQAAAEPEDEPDEDERDKREAEASGDRARDEEEEA
jgi:lambda family phage portal protein